MEIPLLRLKSFTNGTEAERATFCNVLRQTLSNFGFVKITGHDISDETIQELFSWNQKFFALPAEVKMKVAHATRPNPHRGYSYVGQEKLSQLLNIDAGSGPGNTTFDVKESLDHGSEEDKLYPNLWVPESDLPGFRQFMSEFYKQCHQLHLVLLEAIALSFSLEPSFLINRCMQNSSELRLNHYPLVKAEELLSGRTRISPHTDFGTLTLLFQDSVGGLEIEKQEFRGSYLPIEAKNMNEVIINVGDCLQRWTNDRLRSANHRVTLPPALKDSPDSIVPDRYSVAYFGKPDRDSSVCTLPEFLDEVTKPKYSEEMTAWEYNQSRLLHTY